MGDAAMRQLMAGSHERQARLEELVKVQTTWIKPAKKKVVGYGASTEQSNYCPLLGDEG